MTEQKLTDTNRLIAAIEDVAQELYNINANLERLMDAFADVGGHSSSEEKLALRTLPITD